MALQELEEEGWEYVKDYADPKFVKVRREKPFDEQFEDRVWFLFYQMGFKFMNKDRNFKMSYDFKIQISHNRLMCLLRMMKL